MTKEHYQIVEHDGGWAYTLQDVFSETFPTKADAQHAAGQAAAEQRTPGSPEEIEFQDKAGKWHVEHSDGADRPETDVT